MEKIPGVKRARKTVLIHGLISLIYSMLYRRKYENRRWGLSRGCKAPVIIRDRNQEFRAQAQGELNRNNACLSFTPTQRGAGSPPWYGENRGGDRWKTARLRQTSSLLILQRHLTSRSRLSWIGMKNRMRAVDWRSRVCWEWNRVN